MKKLPAALLAATTATTLLLSACSSNDDEKADKSAAADGTAASASQSEIVQPPALNDQEGTKKDLADAKCEADKDGNWTGSGTVTNSSEKDLTYVVSFSIAATEGGTVRARAMEVLDLKAGESKEIKKENFFTTTEGGVQCVITVNRGTKA